MHYLQHFNRFFVEVENSKQLLSTHISLYLALYKLWRYHPFQNPITATRKTKSPITPRYKPFSLLIAIRFCFKKSRTQDSKETHTPNSALFSLDPVYLGSMLSVLARITALVIAYANGLTTASHGSTTASLRHLSASSTLDPRSILE